jgi:uncharacterized protein
MLSVYTPLDLLAVATIVAMVVYGVVVGIRIARTPRSELDLVPRYRFTIARAIVMSLIILLDWHLAGRPWASLGLDIPIGFPGRVGLVIAAVIVGAYAYALLLRKISPQRVAALRGRLDSVKLVPQTPREVALFPVMAIIASPFEELAFRGFLMWFLFPLAGLWGGALVSAVLFGIAHAYQGWRGILRTGAIGLAFATGYALTHSLWWLMIAHIGFNLLGGLLARRIARMAAEPVPITH